MDGVHTANTLLNDGSIILRIKLYLGGEVIFLFLQFSYVT